MRRMTQRVLPGYTSATWLARTDGGPPRLFSAEMPAGAVGGLLPSGSARMLRRLAAQQQARAQRKARRAASRRGG